QFRKLSFSVSKQNVVWVQRVCRIRLFLGLLLVFQLSRHAAAIGCPDRDSL
ncbi:MAG: hypothetical protein ACI945_002334, partial [Pseudohongiellaceae bacterium]